VARGLGISICASLCLTGTENLVAIPVGRYFPRRNYGIILRKGKHLSPAGRRFIDLLSHTNLKANPVVKPVHGASHGRLSKGGKRDI
jgi:DNA-binding transcriptional LysR family regulator